MTSKFALFRLTWTTLQHSQEATLTKTIQFSVGRIQAGESGIYVRSITGGELDEGQQPNCSIYATYLNTSFP
ncbi:hypothetical protein AB1N83_007184 [Pleurotus pulmonarius]